MSLSKLPRHFDEAIKDLFVSLWVINLSLIGTTDFCFQSDKPLTRGLSRDPS